MCTRQSQHDPTCYSRMIWLLLLLMVSLPAIAMAECDYQPDATDCSCFVDAGVWDPSGGYIQDIAGATIGTRESCFDLSTGIIPDGGKPYYQMVLGCDEPIIAFSMAVAMFHGMKVDGRGAWCSETVSYWHKHAYIPYPEGYRSDWYLDWKVSNAPGLVEWYAHEELLDKGRGRWISSTELGPLKSADVKPGINVPVPGAYVAIRGYQITVHPSGGISTSWMNWEQTGHSLMINEMWIHTNWFGNDVCRIEVTLLEGNSDNRVRDDRDPWTDILALTPQGTSFIGTNRKIFGFGIDLDVDGNPIYDPARLHWVNDSTIICPQDLTFVMVFDPQWDEQQFQKMATYASLLRSNGGPKVLYSGSLNNIGGIPNGVDTEWQFPAAELEEEDVEIVIDLLYAYPLPIRGIELRWDGASLPLGYSIQFAGADENYRDAVVPDLSILRQLQPRPKEYPVSYTFGDDGASGVRFVKLIFPEGTFDADAVLQELRVRYTTGWPEDAPEHPEGTHLAPNTANAYGEPMYLWSPNHKLEKIEIKGVFDPEGSPVNIKIASIRQDEPVNGLGDGDMAPDGIIENETTGWVRAERSGKGNGRVYEINFIATDAQGASSLGSVKVMVPHSKKQMPVDDGQNYDSTQIP